MLTLLRQPALTFEQTKFKEFDKVIKPYIYIDQGDVTNHQGEKPINFQWKSHNTVLYGIYDEFVTDTTVE